jgi:hypothetical protein
VTSDASETVVAFDIHGLLGIRLHGPSEADIRTVGKHLGLAPTALAGAPEITIGFVDELPIRGPLRYLGREDVGFTDDLFVVLRSRNLARARLAIAFETLGQHCALTCERGLPAIPLLRQLINLAMLAKGVVPVHAAAFNHSGKGVLVTGWSHGSKTGSLLAFMADGAQFVGDEWIYLSAERDSMYGLPDQLEARPWYLRELPEYQKHVGAGDRLRISATDRVARLLSSRVPGSERRNSLAAKVTRQAHQSLIDQQSIHMRPRELFGADACVLQSRLDVVVVAVSHGDPEIAIAPTLIEKVAAQMAASFQFEQASLLSTYQKHLFAFPERRNTLLDNAEDIYRNHALRALAGKQARTMYHPYPVSTAALRAAIQPLLA